MHCLTVEAIPKFVRTCTIVYAESAVTHRRSIVRGFMTVEQTENMHVVMSPDAETLPGRPNKHFQGTTSGNAIMGVGHPEEREWTMTVGQKKTLFGPDARTTASMTNLENRVGVRNPDETVMSSQCISGP